MSPVLLSLIAVSGTLAGSLLTGWMQLRNNKAQREDANLRAQQDNAVNAVADLKRALDRHRAKMWKIQNDRHAGTPQPDGDEQTHETRSAISEPLTRVELRVQGLAEAAKTAAQATYDMRDSTNAKHLEMLHLAARDAADKLVAEAADQFKRLGIGLALPPTGKASRAVHKASR